MVKKKYYVFHCRIQWISSLSISHWVCFSKANPPRIAWTHNNNSIHNKTLNYNPTHDRKLIDFNYEEMPQWQHAIPLFHRTWMLGMCEHDLSIGMEIPYMLLLLGLYSYQIPGTRQSFYDVSLTLLAPTRLLYCYKKWSPTKMRETRENIRWARKSRKCKDHKMLYIMHYPLIPGQVKRLTNNPPGATNLETESQYMILNTKAQFIYFSVIHSSKCKINRAVTY